MKISHHVVLHLVSLPKASCAGSGTVHQFWRACDTHTYSIISVFRKVKHNTFWCNPKCVLSVCLFMECHFDSENMRKKASILCDELGRRRSSSGYFLPLNLAHLLWKFGILNLIWGHNLWNFIKFYKYVQPKYLLKCEKNNISSTF